MWIKTVLVLLFLSLATVCWAVYDTFDGKDVVRGPYFGIRGGFVNNSRMDIYIFTKHPDIQLFFAETPFPSKSQANIPFQINITGGDGQPFFKMGSKVEGQPQTIHRHNMSEYRRIKEADCYMVELKLSRNEDSTFNVGVYGEEPVRGNVISFTQDIFFLAVDTESMVAVIQYDTIGAKGEILALPQLQTRGDFAPDFDINVPLKFIQQSRANGIAFDLGPLPPHKKLGGKSEDARHLGNVTLHICLHDIVPQKMERFWVAHDAPPFDIRADRDFLFGIEIRRREEDLRFVSREKGVDIVRGTAKLKPPGSNGLYSACVDVEIKESAGSYTVTWKYEETIFTASGIKGPVAHKFISFQGKFGTEKTKAEMSIEDFDSQGKIINTEKFEAHGGEGKLTRGIR